MSTADRERILAALSRPSRTGSTPLDTERNRELVGELLMLDSQITNGIVRVVAALERSDAATADVLEAEPALVVVLDREEELEREAGIERGASTP